MAAVVTGGSGGIGSACAAALLRDGCSVTLLARDEAKLRATAARLGSVASDSARVDYVAGDALERRDVRGAVEMAASAGAVRICAATVGGGHMAPVLTMKEDRFLFDLRLNLLGAFLAIQEAAPLMMEAGGGSIVCISTTAARLSFPFLAGYAAGKAGLEALVRVAADELGPRGVRVNAVRPGLVHSRDDSPLFADPAIVEQFLEQKPLGRTGVPGDIAGAVRFLAGPESSWVTGQSFAVDGGNELRRAPWLERLAR